MTYTIVGVVLGLGIALVFITEIIAFTEEGKEGKFQVNFADHCDPLSSSRF